MDLSTSLQSYEYHLTTLIERDDQNYRFRCLSWYDSLGCFCEPGSSCHVDIIRGKLKDMGLKVPDRQCVKAKWLRKQTNSDNLEQWVSNPKNHLCTRRGRIFIGSKKQNNHRVYHYAQSDWCNPYKVSK